MRPFCDRQPALALKPLRPYLSMNWGLERRIKVMAETFKLIRKTAPLREAVLNQAGSVVARVASLRGEACIVHLGWDPRFHKEGELVISLRDEGASGHALSLVLAFERQAAGCWRGYIGCIQGGDETPDRIRALTKSLHGLRPKSLLLYVAQVLAQQLNLCELLGVSRAIHMHRGRQLVRLRRRTINLDYDRLWTEAGGIKDAEDWYRLPLHTTLRNRAEIAANKRAQYARRYALMDDLQAQLRGHFQFQSEAQLAPEPIGMTGV